MIHNAKYVLPGVLLFFLVASGPFLLHGGKRHEPPILERPAQDKGLVCVEDRTFMASSHAALLHAWRDAAVRRNIREYIATNGGVRVISLERSCLSCHRKAGFCDPCHVAHLAKPSCWECHIPPEGAS